MRKILWSPDPTAEVIANPLANIRRPSVLVSGAAPPLVGMWLERHPWASSIPLVMFARDDASIHDAETLTARHERIRTGGSSILSWCSFMGEQPFHHVVGPHDLLLGIEHKRSILERMSAVPRSIAAGQAIAGCMGDCMPWEILGDASDGTLAVGLCLPWGRSVVVAGNGPGPLFAAACQKHGISTVGTLRALAA